MNTESRQARRDYDSPLRASQASNTRDRILAAFAEQVVETGLDDFSIERVAKRAGVATRTVYHHFPNRDDLLAALAVWLDETFMPEPLDQSVDLAEFLHRLENVFASFEQNETLIRAQLITELGRSVREHGRSSRRPHLERVVKDAAPSTPPAQLRRITSVVHFLASSEAWRSLKDESGLSGHEAGEAVLWAIQTLVGALGQADAEQKRTRGKKDAE